MVSAMLFSRLPEIFKFRNYLKRDLGPDQGFTNLVNQRCGSIADEPSALADVNNPPWIQSNQTCA